MDPQSDLLEIAALSALSIASENEILSEHAWNLASEKASVHGLTVEDAVSNSQYVDPIRWTDMGTDSESSN